MTDDLRVSADRADFVAKTGSRLRTAEETGRALAAALAQRDCAGAPHPARASRLRFVVAALVMLCGVLVVPIPYRRQVGWDATFQAWSKEGQERVVTIHLEAANAKDAERRARGVAESMPASVTVAPHFEIVWGTVYAMAREKLFSVDVGLEGRTDSEVEGEIRTQLEEQGWPHAQVTVHRDGGGVSVDVGVDDPERHRIHIQHFDELDERGKRDELDEQAKELDDKTLGRIQIRPAPIDDTREPGMSDAQLREKILRQLRAQGRDAEVSVEGDRIRIHATTTNPPPPPR